MTNMDCCPFHRSGGKRLLSCGGDQALLPAVREDTVVLTPRQACQAITRIVAVRPWDDGATIEAIRKVLEETEPC